MLKELLWFEIRNRLYKVSTLIYFMIYFLMSFFLGIIYAGAFQGINIGFSTELALNSPIVLNNIITGVGYFILLIIAPIFGQSINKDFETNFRQIIFSTPLSKTTYFFIRYLGSFIVVITILFSIGLGVWTATLMPFVNKLMITQNHFLFYLVPYLYTIIPNILIFGALFIAVIAIFKKMSSVYVVTMLIFTGWLIAGTIVSDIDNKLIGALIDPFGFIAAKGVTQYWSIEEQKIKTIPLTGYFLYNRILWGAIGTFFLFLGYFLFEPFKLSKEKKNYAEKSSNFKISKEIAVSLRPKSWKVLFELSLSEFKQAFSNIYFLIMLLCGVLFIFICSSSIGKFYGTETLPVTYHVFDVVGGAFYLFVIIIITYYSGELVWKDREQFIYELMDSKPVTNLYIYISKFLSLVWIQIFLSFIILISGLIIQIFKGYYFFELNVYFKHLFFCFLLPNIFICIFALFIQTFSKNKYIGHSIVILFYILMSNLEGFGFNHKLYLIGSLPRENYSDMNKFGNSLYPFMIFFLYWGLFHFGLAYLTIRFWLRGSIVTWKERFIEFKIRMQPLQKKVLIGTLLSWILVGGFIYYNTNILNIYQTNAAKQRDVVDYELKYKKFEKIVQPEINSVVLNVNIFPEKQSMSADGVFKYKNCSTKPITKILLNINKRSNINLLKWNRKISFVHYDKRLEVSIFDLMEPLQPNEDIELEFQLEVKPKGFTSAGTSKKIIKNGTFFNGSDFFPIIGYISSREMGAEKIRRKYNLPEKDRMPDMNDKTAVNKTYISQEGTWIDFEATVSTSKDQIAIAPGYLVKEWEENNRRFFHYKMDKPILNFYAFTSGLYALAQDKWNDVKIEIYHHSNHSDNIPHMIKAIKNSLDYYTKNFSPYQFNQVRIIEFPRYASFTQSFPNTIFYSEAIGFIAKIVEKDSENVDYVFYVTSHEMAHQWWAHQVIGGNVQGSTMLSESLAQYSALMIQEKEYGSQQMGKFLRYEMDNYLSGRSVETKKELPLMFNEGQQYIHYNKGSLIFYALKDYLGEETVNKVLKEYIRDVAFQRAPFTRAIDLVERFKKITPEDKKYLIEDFFETITFYRNHTESVTFSKNKDKYQVEIKSDNKKFRVDELGKEREISMNDYIDIGVFDKEGNILYLQKHKVKSGKNIFHVQVEKMPYKAGVDPINILIDKDSKDHLIKAISK